jgi:hypothetical protein
VRITPWKTRSSSRRTLVVTLLPRVAGPYYVIDGDPDATVTIADND